MITLYFKLHISFNNRKLEFIFVGLNFCVGFKGRTGICDLPTAGNSSYLLNTAYYSLIPSLLISVLIFSHSQLLEF